MEICVNLHVDDPIYGGNMHICVSDINGVLYGQGVFSKLGYMRGTITVGDVFTGEFWLQGWESMLTFLKLELCLEFLCF